MARDDNEPELIETIITELDQSTFALALIGGAVIGGFLLYMFLKRDEVVRNVTPKESETDVDSLAEKVAAKLTVNFAQQENEHENEPSEQETFSPWSAPGSPAMMGM